MPVIDGVFVPRSPLTPAELHVDFLSHDNHVLDRRVAVEKLALPKANRIASTAQLLGDIRTAHDNLTVTLADALAITARFGYRQAQTELGKLRVSEAVAAAANPPAPADSYGITRRGLPGIYDYLANQAIEVTAAVVIAVMRALRAHRDPTFALQIARRDGQRALHNGVLELVGSTLNLGRTVGAQQLDPPPVYALRSEQLDAATCEPCSRLHGTIVQFGSPAYFAALPPTGCLGGGRCRALMIFADGGHQVRQPGLLAA